MFAVRTKPISCQLCQINQFFLRTSVNTSHDLIKPVTPVQLFAFANQPGRSWLSMSSSHRDSLCFPSHIKLAFGGVDRSCLVIESNFEGIKQGCLTMGVGCIVGRRRRSMAMDRQGPVRKFSVTTSLEAINAIQPSTTTDIASFDELFTKIVEDFTKKMFPDEELKTVMNWFARVLQYNVPHGKKNRGTMLVETYRLLTPAASPRQIVQARILGWCVEMLQAYYLIADDIMDQSVTRRGRPCWYRQDGVGNIAINDCFYIRACISQLLKKYCQHEPCYADLVNLFNEVDMRTVIGQGLDLLTSPMDGTVDLDSFTMKRYETIVTWKTAYYSFYLPVALAMYMSGIRDDVTHEHAKTILLKMGHFFQVQDDYLDCYGEPAVTGKIGTDIQDNKCGWLINRALMLCDKRQKQLLHENYGRHDPEKVRIVKKVYDELSLQEEFRNYEKVSYLELVRLIEESNSNLPKKMFIDIADKIYRRNK